MDHLESWLAFVHGERVIPDPPLTCLDCGRPVDGDITQHDRNGAMEGHLCPECYALGDADCVVVTMADEFAEVWQDIGGSD